MEKRERDRILSVVTVLISLGLIHVLGDPSEGAGSAWARLGPRWRGWFRVLAGFLFLNLAWLGFNTPLGELVLEYLEEARKSGDEGLGQPLLIFLIVPCAWVAWGLHGVILARNWRESGALIRTCFILLGCVFLLGGNMAGYGAYEVWKREHYWDNPKFHILKTRSEELKSLCEEGVHSFRDRYDCLLSNQKKMEEIRADVEELVLKYPSLKTHDVMYSMRQESDRRKGEVFSYSQFMEYYHSKVRELERLSPKF